jgi:hypothetical protein
MEFDIAAIELTAQRFRAGMWRSATEEAVDDCGIEEARFGRVQVTIVEASPEIPTLNLVLGAAEPGAVKDGQLAAGVDWADTHGVDYVVRVALGRSGAGWAEDWLNWEGFERVGRRTKLVRRLPGADLPEVPGVTVYEIGKEESEGEGLSAIVEEAYHLPPVAAALVFCLPIRQGWHCYTAALDERVGIVSCGSMLIEGKVAQLGIDATLRPARAQGCQQALLRRRLLDATRAGCHTVFAELADCQPEGIAIARHNLRRAGFETTYDSQDWRRPRE